MQDGQGRLIDRISARRAILGRIDGVGKDLGAARDRIDLIESALVTLEAREDPVPLLEDRLARFGGRIGALEEQLRATADGLDDLRSGLARVEAALGAGAAVSRPPAAAHDRMPYVSIADLRALGRVEAEAAMRARCMVVPVDAATALCRILGRHKMFVDRRDAGFAPHLMFEGYWEYWLTEFVWRNVTPGQVVLDVGANHGYYTVLMADLVGAGGRVHAFEPNPRMVDLLGRTVALNGFWTSVQVHAAAVAAAAGPPMAFAATEAEPKNGRLLMPGEDAPGAALIEVPVLTLDEAVPGPVDFVKIDVEGAEELAWRGMQGLIDRSPGIRIVLEFNPGRCRDAGGTLAQIAARFPLREIGFDAQARGCTAAEVLGRSEDTLLYLSRLDPA